MSRPLIVAIDGPAGAGKSSVSKLLARRLGFSLVDTGAIYRCVALAARRRNLALDDDAALGSLLATLTITFRVEGEHNHVFLDGVDVSQDIRSPENSLAASQVSSRKVVRDGLLDLQRRLALQAGQGAILEGRDIGTVVFPDADVKFFLFADPGVRARRRYEELFEKGKEQPFANVLNEQQKRDKEDSEREVAPLKPAPDALRVDSSALPLSDVVHLLEARIREVVAARSAR
ncbi:MAG: (d)CMP kinase [Myxococcaceae bacterium]|nr:(d)CMP kinase [Myxococcaceae bacterium]